MGSGTHSAINDTSFPPLVRMPPVAVTHFDRTLSLADAASPASASTPKMRHGR
jgi:hypothetical protein